MRAIRLAAFALIVGGSFAAGWVCGGSGQGGSRAPISAARAQEVRSAMDPNLLAIAMGLASVAVDTEATALKLNDVSDRLVALERRVQQLEAPRPR